MTKGDLISRQAVLDKFADYVGGGMSMNDFDALWNIVEKMPSAENKGDLISRQAILDRTVNRNSVWNKITDSEGNNLEDILNSIPSADVRENIHGEWIDNENGTFTCNKCGEIICCNGKFCCECGADMRGET